MATEGLVGIKEAASYLGYGNRLNPVYLLVHRKAIPHIKLGKKILRFRISDLQKFAESKMQGVETSEPKQQTAVRRGRQLRKTASRSVYVESLIEQAKRDAGAEVSK